MIQKLVKFFTKLSPFNIFLIILLIGLLYGGISLYTKYLGYSKFMNRTQVTVVKVNPVIIGNAEKTYSALSTIEAHESVEITSKVNGIIDKIHFNESSDVSAGQKLFSIIASDIVGKTEISAPFSGVIGLNEKNVGDQVKRGEILASLDNYSKMKLEFDLPEKILPYLQNELTFTATTDSLPGKTYTGTLDFIDTRINRDTRTIKVYALVPNQNNLLRPGILMKVKLYLEIIPNSILIPEEALLSINKKHYVYVVREDTAEIREVSIGIRNEDTIEIISGLMKKDNIVYMGQEKLKNGSLIKIIK